MSDVIRGIPSYFAKQGEPCKQTQKTLMMGVAGRHTHKQALSQTPLV